MTLNLPVVGQTYGNEWAELINAALLELEGRIGTGGGDGGDTVNPYIGKTWDQFTGGFCWHRTGGSGPATIGGTSTAGAVPGSRSAAYECIRRGFSFLDVDVSIDACGVAWVSHERTEAGTTMDITGPIYSTDTAVLGVARNLASKTCGGRYQDEPLMTFAEFIDEFAGKLPILAEPKDQAAGAEWARTLSILAPIIQARGLEDRVILTMSATNVDTNAAAARAAGIRWGFYTQSGNTNDATILADAVTYGCSNVMLTTAATSATVAAYRNIPGCVVIGYGSGRRSSIATYAALGITGIMDERAPHVSGLVKGATVSPYEFGAWGSGIEAAGQNRPRLDDSGLGLVFDNPDGNGRQWYLDSTYGLLPTTFTLNMKLRVLATPTTGNWFAVHVCAADDSSLSDNGGSPQGYTCFIFPGAGSPSSGLRIATRNTGTFVTQVQSSMGTVVPANTDFYLRVVVSASSIVFSRRDEAGALIGTEATYSDSAFRGPYLHFGGPVGPIQPALTKVWFS